MNNQRRLSLLLLLILLVAAFGGFYLYTNSDDYIARHGKTVTTEGPFGGKVTVENAGRRAVLDRKVEGSVTLLENGWSKYTSAEWGLTFSYPSDWKIIEKSYNENGVASGDQATVEVRGGGYSIVFSTVAKDYPGGVATISSEYMISGKKQNVLEDKEGDGFMQGMRACDLKNNLRLVITSPVSSKEITDKIIASVVCPKS